MLIRDAEVYGHGRADLRIVAARIAEVGCGLQPQPGEELIATNGGALLPGLHDHHLHLNALAMEQHSVACGPPQVHDASQLATVLRRAPVIDADGWIRGTGYHESVAGLPDMQALDAWVADRPLRLQHRSGKLWLLNSRAAAKLRLDAQPAMAGLERDAQGRATGRLYRLDAWLRRQLGGPGLPDLGAVSQRLASYGVTELTDASPANDKRTLRQMQLAIAAGQLRQRLRLFGTLRLPASAAPRLQIGAVKLLLDEDRLPAPERFEARIRRAHQLGRAVAIHCVTRSELIFALAALAAAGAFPGDRIEHASICPDEALPLLRDCGVCVVTQHGFLFARGERYALEVAAEDQALLYRGRAFLAAGIPLAGSTDAPYGPDDPWCVMRAAVGRQSRDGRSFATAECLTPEEALALFATTPGGRIASLQPGTDADLCLMDKPWHQVRTRLSSQDVSLTLCAGNITFRRGC